MPTRSIETLIPARPCQSRDVIHLSLTLTGLTSLSLLSGVLPDPYGAPKIAGEEVQALEGAGTGGRHRATPSPSSSTRHDSTPRGRVGNRPVKGGRGRTCSGASLFTNCLADRRIVRVGAMHLSPRRQSTTRCLFTATVRPISTGNRPLPTHRCHVPNPLPTNPACRPDGDCPHRLLAKLKPEDTPLHPDRISRLTATSLQTVDQHGNGAVASTQNACYPRSVEVDGMVQWNPERVSPRALARPRLRGRRNGCSEPYPDALRSACRH